MGTEQPEAHRCRHAAERTGSPNCEHRRLSDRCYPPGPPLLIQHRDQPGAIGRVGTLLGKHGINIATMQVGRRDVGGQAIMMLSVDKPVPPDIQQRLAQLENIETVQEIDL